MMAIGLTGGIASGKSTVARMIQDAGISVIDADVYAHRALEPGERAHEAVVAHFGPSILFDDGTINRKKLGAIIFNDRQERDILNHIVHPVVREKMNEQKQYLYEAGHSAVVLDIPLLFESRLTQTVDRILLVYVDEALQQKRLMARDGSSEQEALDRIRAQIPMDEKRCRADAVIDNTATVAKTHKQLHRIFLSWGLTD